MTRTGVMAFAAACVLAVTGCNDDDKKKSPAADGAEVKPTARTPDGSVLRLWREVAGGSPTMVLEYDKRILRLLGSSTIVAAFSPPAPRFGGEPKVDSVEQTQLGTQVTVKSRAPGEKTVSTSVYLLQKAGDRWVVRYDANLNDAVRAYVAQRAQQRIDPTEVEPSPRANARAQRVVNALRALALPAPRDGTLPIR